MLGDEGFEKSAAQVESIEKALGIHDLKQGAPKARRTISRSAAGPTDQRGDAPRLNAGNISSGYRGPLCRDKAGFNCSCAELSIAFRTSTAAQSGLSASALTLSSVSYPIVGSSGRMGGDRPCGRNRDPVGSQLSCRTFCPLIRQAPTGVMSACREGYFGLRG